MNRFEKAVHDCMNPTAKLLEQTTKPLHRAILLNFWRHVHLEGAGEYERYDERARLAGQHLYEDKTSLRIEEVDRSEAITPARVREIHRELLAKLEAARGPNFWVLGNA